MKCANNLKQIALAAHNFHDHHLQFPTGARLPVDVGGVPTRGTNLWVELLLYFEQDNLYKLWDDKDNRNNVAGGSNATTAQVIKLLICPSDYLPEPVFEATSEAAPLWPGFYGMTSYGGNAGKRSFHQKDASRDGVFFLGRSVRIEDISDGTSNTLLFGERYHRDPQFDRLRPQYLPNTGPLAAWGKWASVGKGQAHVTLSTPVRINFLVPADVAYSDMENRVCAFGSGHPRGANFALADGSVRFLSDSTALLVLQGLSTIAGNEVVAGDF
jgi:prepilin-type processing-associated H-X9-DG protein